MFKLMGFWLLVCVASAAQSRAAAPSLEHGQRADAPPRKCEIRQRAWCIYQEGVEITDHQKVDRQNPHDYIWTLRNVRHPESVLVIFEPEGCRDDFSDGVAALGFETGVPWQDKRWDQMLIRLKADGTCDLRMLISPYDQDPLEWAFSVGRVLIAACADESCNPVVPTPADVTEQYRKRFKREEDKSH